MSDSYIVLRQQILLDFTVHSTNEVTHWEGHLCPTNCQASDDHFHSPCHTLFSFLTATKELCHSIGEFIMWEEWGMRIYYKVVFMIPKWGGLQVSCLLGKDWGGRKCISEKAFMGNPLYFWDNLWDGQVSKSGSLVELRRVDEKTDKAR